MMMIYDENQSNTAAAAAAAENTEKKRKQRMETRRRALSVIHPNLQTSFTRKSAAQMLPCHSQECKKLQVTVTNHEGCKAASDLETPLVETQEIEMEDIFEEPVLDIDGPDASNPLAVAVYVDDVFSNYRRMEANSCVAPQYMSHQADINEKMRAILIDWLIEVHYKFELREETLYLTVNLIDRFLERQNVARKKLQLVGLIAMLLACKYEEVSVPVVDDLIFISDKAYCRQDLLHMEKVMLNTLQFNMSCPTPYVFLRRFLKAAESEKKVELLCLYLLELSLVEYEMIKFPPSLLAAAAVYTAHSSLYGFSQWSKTCQFYTTYSESQLLECSRLMVSFHHKAGSGKLTGVHRKYSTSKFGYAAKSQPAVFLLQQEDEAI